MALNKELLEILACPKCQGKEGSELILLESEEGLQCPTCAIVYPIREEIPVMLIEEAVAIDDWKNGARATVK